MSKKYLYKITLGVLWVSIYFMSSSAWSSSAWAKDLPIQKLLPLDLMTQAAMAAIKKCSDDGYKVSVAIVDQSGLLKVQLKADGAGPHTLESSRRKAYTANSLRGPTQKFAELTIKDPKLKGLAYMNNHILLLGGGFPIKIGDETLGGVGVGGAPGTKLDEVCARAALRVLKADEMNK